MSYFLFRIALDLICCYYVLAMATTKRTRFSRRLPDHVTDELVNVLGDEDKFFGFNDLFELVYDRLKERNAVSGGEEMLRLRAYEKLQNLVTRGLVEKSGKEYKGLERIEEAHSDNIAAQQQQA
ncbi:MAG: hypothetical protein MK312_10920 [Roseibacillus sp.]|nr:hypothetical protein [Roseibacillus sp.]